MFVLNAKLARQLNVEGYGQYSYVFAFLAFFPFLADFGLIRLISRDAVKTKQDLKEYYYKTLPLKALLNIITLTTIYIVTKLISSDNVFNSWIYLGSIWFVFHSTTLYLHAFLRAQENMFYEALTKVFYSLILFISIWTFLSYDYKNLHEIILAYVISAVMYFVATCLITLRQVGLPKIRINFTFLKNLLLTSWPFALNTLLITVYLQLDSVLINLFLDNQATGIYAASNSLSVASISVVFLGFTALYTTLSKIYHESPKHYYKYVGMLVRIIVPSLCVAYFLVFLFSDKLILFFYGEKYSESIMVLKLLSVSNCVFLSTRIFSQSLMISNRQKRYLAILTLGVVVNISASIILINQIGIQGAAISNVISAFTISFFLLLNYLVARRSDLL
jgi:O-antigen/teichoic acid export membrane protein